MICANCGGSKCGVSYVLPRTDSLRNKVHNRTKKLIGLEARGVDSSFWNKVKLESCNRYLMRRMFICNDCGYARYI